MKWIRKNLIFTILLLLVVSSLTGCQSKEVNAVDTSKEGKTAANKIVAALTQVKPRVEPQVAGNINLLHRTRDINPRYKETLWAFQYDILFSDKYLWDEQNQYVPAPVHLGYDDIKINSINYENGILTVLGENFNLHSKIYINNKKYKPIYISKNQLELEIDELKVNASIKVSQVTDMNEVLYTTNSIINKSK